MYLKKIIIQHFKGFGEKTVVDFFPGIGALVGPNGCGKSNIVDAIKWVLGEQKISEIRGERMQDIIFNGATKEGTAHFAEVEIVFNNSPKIFDLEQKEVAIMRRLYRSGEMEYFINKEQCRLKDVQNLLFDTGLSRGGYSIIAQGSINKILASSHQEKMRLFEEAASITKYRERQREYERKISKAKENLQRVEDIFKELSKRRHTLQKQSQASQEYFKFKQQLRTVELFLSAKKLENLEKKINQTLIQLTKIQTKKQATEKRLKEYTHLREQVQDVYAQENLEWQREEFRLKNEIGLLEGKQNLLSDRLKEKTLELKEREQGIKDVEKHVIEAKKNLERHALVLKQTEKKRQDVQAQEKVIAGQLQEQRLARKSCETKIAELGQSSQKNEEETKQIRQDLDKIPEELFQEMERLFPLAKILSKDKQKEEPETTEDFFKYVEVTSTQIQSLLQEQYQKLLSHLTLQDNRKVLPHEALEKEMEGLKALLKTKLVELVGASRELKKRESYREGIAKVLEKIYKRKEVFILELGARNQKHEQYLKQLTQEKSKLDTLIQKGQKLAETQFKVQQQYQNTLGELERLNNETVRLKSYEKEWVTRQVGYQKELQVTSKLIQGIKQELTASSESLQTLQAQAKTTAQNLLKVKKNSRLGQIKLQKIEASKSKYEEQNQSLNTQYYETQSQKDIFKNEQENLIKYTKEYLEEDLMLYTKQIQSKRIKGILRVSGELLSTSTPTTAHDMQVKASLPVEVFNLRILETRELEKLQQRFKERLQYRNVVNPLAEQELEELTKEYDIVAKERLDIRSSLKNLANLANQINRESKLIFNKTFKKISKNFSILIKELFDGGKGTLVYKPHANPEESEVHVTVQPPGKALQKLDLFSGGEKSLIVLALMFSIFINKAAPLCILDEADAALDDENISRFLKLLQTFQDKTQILVISHNRNTFSVFDYLYGISMREGISRIFSLKMPKKQHKLVPGSKKEEQLQLG